MKHVFLILACLLTGCASHLDKAGNADNYPLTPPQAAQVAQSVTAELIKRYPARTVFGFPHESNRAFPVALEKAIRDAGMGVSIDDVPGYQKLRYRLERLNAHQFFVVVSVNQNSFQTIWTEDDNALARLKTVTEFEVSHE